MLQSGAITLTHSVGKADFCKQTKKSKSNYTNAILIYLIGAVMSACVSMATMAHDPYAWVCFWYDQSQIPVGERSNMHITDIRTDVNAQSLMNLIYSSLKQIAEFFLKI